MLLTFSTYLDYFTGKRIFFAKSQKNAKIWLIISVGINLGFLGFFKYYNFFVDQAAELMHMVGLNANTWSLKIILPVGISFYTFHGLSYVFDIYKRRCTPEPSFVNYAMFVCFFPLLVAGPIERANHLLPQVTKSRIFSYEGCISGLKQILWGLFMKVVIADNCATYANFIFDKYDTFNGATLLLGAVFFAFQIYGDFAGYSNIALGTARLLGFELLKNFSYPYFSRDIAEFWRRWHISLSSWFRDYVYIPLGGSRVSKLKQVRNTFIIFLVSGFWHGANWTFIAWGAVNALYFLPLLLTNKNRENLQFDDGGGKRRMHQLTDIGKILMTFFMTVIAWIFFRSPTLTAAFDYIRRLFTNGLLRKPTVFPYDVIVLIALFIAMEWANRNEHFALAGLNTKWPVAVRYSVYYSIVIMLFLFSVKNQEFIYFQF